MPTQDGGTEIIMKIQENKLEKWARIKYMPCIPMKADGTKITGCREHIELSRKAACEGMVLLKNERGALPLKKGTKLAVFGKGQYDYIKGGGGSGDVNCAYIRNIYDGFKVKEAEGKISVFDGLIGFYENELEKQYADGKEPGKTTVEPELPEELLRAAAAYADTAIITISRFSGEDSDRKHEPSIGDFYLSAEEEKMIGKVTASFKNVIAVINAGAQTDCKWFAYNDNISAALYAWQGGMEGGLAVADVICGDVNPSGKLTDTFAKELSDYPSTESFMQSRDYVKYYEDIYVGYRYFETVKGAYDKVIYPFGFGLSYTAFEIYDVKVKSENEKIKVSAAVINTGSTSGRESVQVYFSAPQGKLGKAKYSLAAFKKTDELAPGEAKRVFMEFEIADMASYDDTGKIFESAYVLESGAYSFYVGNSVRNTQKADFEYIVKENTITKQLTRKCAPKNLEKRMLSDGSYEKLQSFENNEYENHYEPNAAQVPKDKAMLLDVADGKVTLDEFIAQLDDKELISLTYGKSDVGIANTAGMGDLKEYGVPNIMTADGPAGLRVSVGRGIYTTAFPSSTLIACTWNPEMMYEIGVAGALEIKENNLGIWLTPGLNIHRNPLCGRNFEYYSEDPLISGEMAAAAVSGIQSQHICACAKHFCANNKEENRSHCNSVVSERALREIYLRGFEICVKKSDPWMIMNAFNMVNGVYTCENHDIITGILRNEWGYGGMVTTDWETPTDECTELKAGNDMKMPYGFPDKLLNDLKDGIISRAEIEVCAKRVLEMILKID